MKYFLFFLLSVFYSVTLSAQVINSIQISQSANNNVYAVVVGISSYSDADVPQLQFANRDAEVFADFLRSKAGGLVPKENIRLLTDSNATTAAVYNAIYWLKKNCKKDDVVFFYFSGHGDLENITMYNNAYLICYNSPPLNYVGMALSVEYLNDIANTLSAQTKAKVVLITDACHSGKLAGNSFKGNLLVGEQLMATKEKEIRIASCKPDQLSNEKIDWGGGRGVFSYYLLNGLKGLADKSKDGIVTLGEIKNYLQASLANDPVLKQDAIEQTPVVNGNDGFPLSTVVQSELNDAMQVVTEDSISNQLVLSLARVEDAMTNVEPDEYFFSILKEQNLEALTDTLQLDKLSAEEIPIALINRFLLLKKQRLDVFTDNLLLKQFPKEIAADIIIRTRDSIKAAAGFNKLNELKHNLINNAEALAQFNNTLVIAFDNKGQEVIGQYLKGDEAELERRRYYNVANSGYDVYPKMFAVALKLTQPDNFFYKILEVKLHYFTGVAMRLKLPVTENTDSLIELAFAEQKQALALETHAAYIYNELGILYLAKKEIAEAENNFIKATGFAPKWAIPWANLAYLYAVSNKNKKGFYACSKADSLQAGLPCTSNNFGLLYENSGNQLFAEEYYRASIDLNSRHYLPFERLGYVYLNTTQYALADSFFYEADLRKKGLHFKKGVEPLWWPNSLDNVMSAFKPCKLDTSKLSKDDVMAFFNWGMIEYQKNNIANAIRILKKVIDIDKQNPLAFHYLGKIFHEQKKWEDAELMFRYAIQFYLDTAAFYQYCDSVIKKSKFPYDHKCFESFFRLKYYHKIEDFYFIATAYETWGHVEEAETMYKAIIQLQPGEIGGYVKLWRMLEKLGRFTETESVIKSFAAIDKERTRMELNAFYRRTIDKFPDNADWNYRLGLLLYSRAAAPALTAYLDSIVWFPKINKEIFIDMAVIKLINKSIDFTINDLSTTISETTFVIIQITDRHDYILLPGINEQVELAGYIFLPRKDGIKYLSRAAELIAEKETLADIYFKIGNIFVWAGSKKQSYPYYAKSLEFDPGNVNARLYLVDAGTAIYKNRATLEQLNYLYDSSQINFEKRLLFAQMTMYAGQFEKSKKLLDEAKAIHPYNLTEFDDLNGRLNLLSNKTDFAIGFYKSYAASKPEDANTYYTIARLYARVQNEVKALDWLEQAIKHGFNYPFIFELDPVMESLRKTDKWETLVSKAAPIKLKRRGVVSDY